MEINLKLVRKIFLSSLLNARITQREPTCISGQHTSLSYKMLKPLSSTWAVYRSLKNVRKSFPDPLLLQQRRAAVNVARTAPYSWKFCVSQWYALLPCSLSLDIHCVGGYWCVNNYFHNLTWRVKELSCVFPLHGSTQGAWKFGPAHS